MLSGHLLCVHCDIGSLRSQFHYKFWLVCNTRLNARLRVAEVMPCIGWRFLPDSEWETYTLNIFSKTNFTNCCTFSVIWETSNSRFSFSNDVSLNMMQPNVDANKYENEYRLKYILPQPDGPFITKVTSFCWVQTARLSVENPRESLRSRSDRIWKNYCCWLVRVS